MQSARNTDDHNWAQGVLLTYLTRMNRFRENGQPTELDPEYFETMGPDQLEQTINDMLSFYAERYGQYQAIITPETQELQRDLDTNGPRGGMTFNGKSIQTLQAEAVARKGSLNSGLCTGEREIPHIIDAAEILGISYDRDIVPENLRPYVVQKPEALMYSA